MTFNAEIATEIAYEDTDRDSARYFVGRKIEIQSFQHALNAASRSKQAIFKIFQGAPGCGKTSLAKHLSETVDESILFIEAIRDFQLSSLEALLKRIYHDAQKQEGQTGKNFARWAIATTERIFGPSIREKADNTLNQENLKNSRVVIHIDEAQSLPQEALETLKALHTGGLDDFYHVPCVVLMTGLAHTKRHFALHPGLSRAAREAAVNMQGLSDEECAESTLNMLNELNPMGANLASKKELANKSEEWSFGWPQHLQGAQKAICEQLLNTKGDLSCLNHNTIEQRCRELRGLYYSDRLELIPVSDVDPNVTKVIIDEIHKQKPPHSAEHLALLCQKVINQIAMQEKTLKECEATATALIEKGIVESKGGKWELSIPSMASWAQPYDLGQHLGSDQGLAR